MAKKKEEDKIRIHNQGKREYIIPAAVQGGKLRKILPGRAIELEESLAMKMLKAYPRDLVEFDSLVSGDKKDLKKENKKLESENKSLANQNAALLEKIAALEAEKTGTPGKKDPPVNEGNDGDQNDESQEA